MGHSEYDPAMQDRRPWNAGRKLGAKRALKPQQVWAIRFWLDREQRLSAEGLIGKAYQEFWRPAGVPLLQDREDGRGLGLTSKIDMRIGDAHDIEKERRG